MSSDTLARMRFSEVASRVTGFSIPIFGVSWEPPTPDRVVARQVLTYLEDRRALYAPFTYEVVEQVVPSVIDIRAHLTTVLAAGGIADDLAGHLRAIRLACRKFLDSMSPGHPTRAAFAHGSPHDQGDQWFHQSLGELRGIVGIHVAHLATKYGHDVEDDLASILPAAPDTQDA